MNSSKFSKACPNLDRVLLEYSNGFCRGKPREIIRSNTNFKDKRIFFFERAKIKNTILTCEVGNMILFNYS